MGKGPARDVNAEARDLVRQLNGAVSDAVRERRALEQMRADFRQEIAGAADALVNAACARVDAAAYKGLVDKLGDTLPMLDQRMEEHYEHLDDDIRHLREWCGRMLGSKDPETLVEEMYDRLCKEFETFLQRKVNGKKGRLDMGNAGVFFGVERGRPVMTPPDDSALAREMARGRAARKAGPGYRSLNAAVIDAVGGTLVGTGTAMALLRPDGTIDPDSIVLDEGSVQTVQQPGDGGGDDRADPGGQAVPPAFKRAKP